MIWFDLQDMGFSHCPCYWLLGRTNSASFLGRRQDPGRFTGLALSLASVDGPFLAYFQTLSGTYIEILY